MSAETDKICGMKNSVSLPEESKEVSKRVAPVVDNTPKVDYREIIRGQASQGSWKLESKETLRKCLVARETEQVDVRDAIRQETLKDGSDEETVYLTLLAIYILQEGYQDFEDEWSLIVAKAIKYLETVGVRKPEDLVSTFTLQVKQ